MHGSNTSVTIAIIIIYIHIMNHDSGFIIGIVRKLCENPNRTLTKSILKITLTILIFHENLWEHPLVLLG